MRSPRLLGLASSALTVALVLSACGDDGSDEAADRPDYRPEISSEWQATLDQADDEGKVTWYTVAPQASVDALVEAFETEFPDIEVEARKMGSAEMDAALEAERSTGAEGADVVTSVNFGTVYQRQADGWYVDLEGPSIASGWAGTEFLDDDQIVSAPLGLLVLGWNTQLFPDGLESYEDLTNPDLGDGAIGAVRPEPAIHADWWAFMEENYDPDFASKLADQKPALYPSAFALQEALAAGEVAVGTFVSATDMEDLKAKGAPVDYVVPEKAWSAQNLFFIPESATHSAAAQVFMDFFASPTGQLAAAKSGYSPVAEVSGETLGGGSEVVMTDVDRVLDADWYAGYLADWKSLFGE
ncbi:extracellular solute-binding protein [Nocardioides carbamazepini]|uniref:extracellular solute-binding protein n=1 Tax=Nocardioides carbamazepini TaxID=2854259 RepID=UPI00214A646E|nr:extracellular solute-binding protein [Nocardioides carbamazepini]MCR1785054.1 extracellular solute-binding protein [Nocardioides carbamazepini]